MIRHDDDDSALVSGTLSQTDRQTPRERERQSNLTSPPQYKCQLAAEAEQLPLAMSTTRKITDRTRARAHVHTRALHGRGMTVDYTMVQYTQEDFC